MKIKPGDTFGKLTVLYRCEENKWGKPLWHCKCSCPAGTELDIPDISLKRGNKVNCGCEPKIYRDLRGKKYGKLTVVDIDHRTEDGRTYWKCTCDCGKYSLEKDEYFIADQHSLVSRKCISCGCERGNDLKYDLIGQTFGTLEVVGHERGKGWECKCKNCGKILYYTNTTQLVTGVLKGHGCVARYEDFADKTIGKLHVKKIHHRNENGVIYWLCDCSCGNKDVVIPSYYLRDTRVGLVKNCGCESVFLGGSSYEKEIGALIAGFTDEGYKKARIFEDNREIDLFYEISKIGIEFNGSAYHATIGSVYDNKPMQYHREKFIEAKSMGIHLVTIFDVDWLSKRDKLEAYLKDLFVKPIALYARDCALIEIDKKLANDFCDKYHLQGGSRQSKYHFGLYYQDELYAVMTFGRQRRQKESATDFELIRYCVKPSYTIVGGANRLLKAFENKYQPKYLISYSDNDFFTGGIYEKLGFTYAGQVTSIPYYWTFSDIEIPRGHTEARKLKEEYPYLSALAERMHVGVEDFVMTCLGARKVYRCGNTKWERYYN